jgi:multiple sugar transport system substrate-binding protein
MEPETQSTPTPPAGGPGVPNQTNTEPMGLSKPPKKMDKKMLMIIAGVAVVLLGLGIWAAMQFLGTKPTTTDQTGDDNTATNLTYAVHWLEDPQITGIKDKSGKVTSKGLQQYLDEYTALHPNVTFTLRQTHVSKYNDELKIAADSGSAPDIYQIYSTWGPSYVRDGLFAEPPADLKADIEQNYVSTAGATIDGKIWGIPTEINNYALLCNKDLMAAAGVTKVPTTWNEVLDATKKMTKRDGDTITQYGIAFTRDNDWSVADPFLSLMYTNGGEFLSSDFKKATFNSAEGVAALEAMVQLFKDKSVDSNSNFFDFKDGKVGCVISPPWTKSTFATGYGDKFADKVAVANFPYMQKAGSLGYSWFTGVMKDSKQQEQAWKFLKWFTSEKLSDGTTRYGTLLANTIGAIPARKDDFERHKKVLGDFFTSVYVNQMKDAKAEPNVLQSGSIKAALMKEIQAAWDQKKTAKEALDSAAAAVNKILEQYYK